MNNYITFILRKIKFPYMLILSVVVCAYQASATEDMKEKEWASQARARALYNLSLVQEKQQNLKESFQLCHLSADEGLREAESRLGALYFCGIGSPQNYSKALKYLSRAADKKDAKAQCMLGYVYYHGHGVKRNTNKGLNFLKSAADQGLTDADVLLGAIYLEEKDYSKTVMHWNRAAQKSHPEGQLYLGVMYYNGKTVKKDQAKGLQLIQEAAEQRLTEAERKLGQIYYDKKEDSTAFKFLDRSAQKLDPEALCCLAIMYSHGLGVEQDRVKAGEIMTTALRLKVERLVKNGLKESHVDEILKKL